MNLNDYKIFINGQPVKRSKRKKTARNTTGRKEKCVKV